MYSAMDYFLKKAIQRLNVPLILCIFYRKKLPESDVGIEKLFFGKNGFVRKNKLSDDWELL